MAKRSAEERFWAKVRISDGCWEWMGARFWSGYGAINTGARVTTTHRFSWELHNGLIPEGLWVLHHCDNRPCVRPDHLFIGTCQDNVNDMIAKGRAPDYADPMRRTKIGWRKLDPDKVRAIRASELSHAELATVYGVDRASIRNIRTGRTWAWVTASPSSPQP